MQLKEAIYRYLPAVIQEFHTRILSYKPEVRPDEAAAAGDDDVVGLEQDLAPFWKST